jgi:hypothetical protein
MFVTALVTVPYVYEGQLRPGTHFTIRDINGSVRVRTGERLIVHATKTATHGNPQAVTIRVDHRPDGLVVCVRYPPNTNSRCDDVEGRATTDNDTRVDFDVTIPRGVALDAATVNGGLDAQADGTVDLASVNGRVAYTGSGAVSVETVNGPIVVRERGRSGSLDVKDVNGSIDVSIPAGAGITLSAHTISGDIVAPGFDVEHPTYGVGAGVTGKRGDGALKVSIENVSGPIRLHF